MEITCMKYNLTMLLVALVSICVLGFESVIKIKLEKGSVNLVFVPIFNPCAYTLYILRHYTNILFK